jgi:putative transposase
MRRSRFTEEQIIQVLKESAAGATSGDVCRRHGISRQTFYGWKQKYNGMDVSEARRLRQLEEDNRRLRKAVADLTLDKQILEETIKLAKKF